MSVRIESEVGLREALDGLARGQQKEILFIGGYEEGRDEKLYQGLVGVHDALMTEDSLRYQETLKRMESVEAGCKKRLRPEYREKFEGCVAFFEGRNWEDVRGIDREGRGSCETVVGGA
jgi:hypothetical protein